MRRFLPAIGSPAYHLMLAVVAICILGPLGGISAAFMNFSIGFFIGGQVLAGILGSVVTLPYGAEGKHGANYMQTMAASVASMCGMAVLIQARHWMGLPEVPGWQMAMFYGCIGMFGGGVGMLYTPVLVDRMQLSYPSGFAVANILRALTDPQLLRRSIAKLGGGMALGYGVGLASFKVAVIGTTGLSASTVGAGMIVGARIAVPALVVALAGHMASPYLVSIGWLEAGAPYRKIGFIIALGTILGAALIDIGLILWEAGRRFRAKQPVNPVPQEDWKRVNFWRLVLWVVCWGVAVVVVGHVVLGEPLRFLLIGVGLCFLFVLVNGISLGISDSNPISSAFVLTVFILAALGLTSPGTGLMCASILLIACSVGGDMQQDRSTGWRLGTNRVTQFRYQMIGIVFGACFAVVLAKIFLQAYPVLTLDQFGHEVEGAQKWQSAMTYKFVGALRGITTHQPHIMKALWLGISIGLVTEVIRKLMKRNPRYQAFRDGSTTGRTTDFLLDAVFIPSPYASSFGGFVELVTVYWWTAGGVFGSLYDSFNKRNQKSAADDALPADMSTMSLAGGGLIAGDSLAALSVGIYGLLSTVL
ncbi:MAG: OPT/YSL family transporter [Cephaloticoccus sp.]|nr:OPT/YSL family transporter [Cephaloticoccus sp.]MCF7759459.1 OPT/YSL family transporter [Cephaloticoccus sp.]